MELTVEQLWPRVEKGVALLHEKRPGWYRRVDVGTLDLRSCPYCVLGQLGGGYRVLSGYKNPSRTAIAELGISGPEYGFSLDDEDSKSSRNWGTLTRLWAGEIAACLAADREADLVPA